jgi:hypothetical protein
MSVQRVFHCIVDDTALITNISEIKTWVSQGIVTLVVPLYSMELCQKGPPQLRDKADMLSTRASSHTEERYITDWYQRSRSREIS